MNTFAVAGAERRTFAVTELTLDGASEIRAVLVKARGPMQAAWMAADGCLGELLPPYAIDVESQAHGRVTLSIRWDVEGRSIRRRFAVRIASEPEN
jgi:hypothetical protein